MSTNKWVVLWHPEKGGLHYETVSAMLTHNQEAFKSGVTVSGYVPLLFCNSSQECVEAVREAKAFQAKRGA